MSDSTGNMTDLDDMDDMEMIMQQLRYEKSLQKQEAESLNRCNYIYRERDVAKERLMADYFGDHLNVALFEINRVTFQHGYYLADGIYPQWSFFVNSFLVANSEKNELFKRRQKVLEKTLKELSGSFKDVGILYANQRVNGLSTSYAEFMMQRYVEDPSIDIPFIFDINGRTLELGRQDFCLITRFRFGKISLHPKEKDRSQFRERVFPETPNLNGQLLLDLVKNDVAFNNLDDDVVRVCLLLALDYTFMGQEIKHVLLKPIVNLVDNLSEWDKFPWGEYMWREFHKRVYNVVAKHREYHLKMLGNNPIYVANYALYGFVFSLKGLETFSNSIHWGRKDENVIPRGVAWSNGLKFEKSNYKMMFYSPNASFQKLAPTSIEMNEPWLKSKVHREVHVRTEVHSFVEEEVCTQSVDKEDMPEIFVLEKNVKEQQMQIVDMQRRLLSLDDITKQLKNGPSKVDHNVDNNVDHKVDHIVRDRVNGNGSVSVQVGGVDHQSTEGASHCMYSEHLDKNWNDVSENHPIDGLDHQSVEAVSQVTNLAEESKSAAIDGLISLQSHDIYSQPFLSPSKVTELINELFTLPNDPGFSQANPVFGCVDVDNM
ncbi:phospholipase-like protein, partial [Tanacetum coccineum]